jgi:hypothetical protein
MTTLTVTAGIDLDIDSDNTRDPNQFPERNGNEDSIEDDPNLPGKLIPLNDDDDDGNAVPDKDQGGAVTGEKDLRPIVLGITPDPNVPAVTTLLRYRLDYPGEVRIWRGKERGDPNDPNQVVVSGDPNRFTRVWVHGDMNGDGVVTFADLDPWVLALMNLQSYINTYLSAYPDMWSRAADIGDFDGDRWMTFVDIDRFVAAIGAPKTYVPEYFWVEGLQTSSAPGVTLIEATADTNDDGDINGSDAPPDYVRATVTAPDLGVPPAWGVGLPISPFSAVNLQNGNVLTALTLVSWKPVGPPVSFTLYHNSVVSAYGTDPNAWGFELGDGWSVSYGARIEGDPNDANHPRATVVGDDGSRTAFTWDPNTSAWLGPAGVYDLLTCDPNSHEWRLARPDLSSAVFDGDGRLTAVQDSSGNAVTVARNGAGALDYIQSASSDATNRVTFTYDPNDPHRLTLAEDPIHRKWGFTYDAAGRLEKVLYCNNAVPYDLDPNSPESYVQFTYYANTPHIATVRSRDGLVWTYQYGGNGKLALVQDPNHPADPNAPYTQHFAYAAAATEGLWTTTYTDRRGYDTHSA